MTQINETLYVEFTVTEAATVAGIRKEFPDDEILESKSFTGEWLIGVIILTGLQGIRTAFKVYRNYRVDLRKAKIKIGKDEVSFEGYSAKEIDEMIANGSIEKVQKRLQKNG